MDLEGLVVHLLHRSYIDLAVTLFVVGYLLLAGLIHSAERLLRIGGFVIKDLLRSVIRVRECWREVKADFSTVAGKPDSFSKRS
jgi:hypothetical protein